MSLVKNQATAISHGGSIVTYSGRKVDQFTQYIDRHPIIEATKDLVKK